MTDEQPISNPYKDIYEFAAKEMSESRSTFERYYKLTVGGLILVGAFAIGSFYWLVGDKYKDIAKQVQEKTDVQLSELTKEMRSRVEAQFETKRMREMIEEVAADQTKRGLSNVINRAVAETVERRVRAEGPQIRSTVTKETTQAVASLAPKIESSAKEQIENSVKQRASEAEHRLDALFARREQLVKAGNLAILARNGVGSAYDQLMTMASATPDPEIKQLASSAQTEVFLELDAASGMYLTRSFVDKKSKEQLRSLLHDPDPLARKAAIDESVNTGDKGIVPELIEIMKRDDFILVRQAAYRGLGILTGQKIQPLHDAEWDNWWQQNKANWPK
jgi:uncharacterized protein YaaW (UPF0174 family)